MVKIPVFTPRGKNLGQGTRKGKAVKGMIAAFRTSDNMSFSSYYENDLFS